MASGCPMAIRRACGKGLPHRRGRNAPPADAGAGGRAQLARHDPEHPVRLDPRPADAGLPVPRRRPRAARPRPRDGDADPRQRRHLARRPPNHLPHPDRPLERRRAVRRPRRRLHDRRPAQSAHGRARHLGRRRRGGWSAPRPDTLVVRLRQPSAPFIASFLTLGANDPFAILPRHIAARYASLDQSSLDTNPVGLGPFRLLRWERGQRLSSCATRTTGAGRRRARASTSRSCPTRRRGSCGAHRTAQLDVTR